MKISLHLSFMTLSTGFRQFDEYVAALATVLCREFFSLRLHKRSKFPSEIKSWLVGGAIIENGCLLFRAAHCSERCNRYGEFYCFFPWFCPSNIIVTHFVWTADEAAITGARNGNVKTITKYHFVQLRFIIPFLLNLVYV